MALLTSVPPESSDKRKKHTSSSSKRRKKQPPPPPPKQQPTSSWDQIKNYFTCKQIDGSTVRDPSSKATPVVAGNSKVPGGSGSCSSICSFRDVVSGNSCRVVHRADNSPETSSTISTTGGQESRLLSKKSGHGSSSSSRSLMSNSVRSININTATNYAGGTSSSSRARGMPLRKLSGCYECHTIVDPSRYPIPRTTICTCKECGEVFPKIESLEHHQAVRHAVSELGPEDSSRNIVEIIFKSSWLKKDNPFCSIERILKVHNTLRTIQRFEDCRDAVKIRANCNTKKNPRCAADGNELLRFHCTTLTCSLGARGSSSLCGSVPGCGVCTIIRHGFQGSKSSGGSGDGFQGSKSNGGSGDGFQGSKSSGVRTTASSGRAHDFLGGNDVRRAMLVCRVIAGRVKRLAEDTASATVEGPEEVEGGGFYDSVAGYAGMYSNLEELYVYNPKAILPCFVVIYKAIES